MFETERLILRKLSASDIDEIYQMRSDAELMRFIREPQTERRESFEWIRMISEKWETERIGFCGMVEKRTREFVGWCGLWQLQETGEIEVGYALRKDFRGRGLATEAARKFLEYGFGELDLDRIVAVAYPENTASQNVMKRLGMEYDGTGRFYGQELVRYMITKDEFYRNGKAAA